LGVVGEHGFAALIEGQEESILLDTGQGLGIKNNALTLGADLSEVTKVVLSHGHYDHTGGLPQVLEAAGGAEIIAHPDIFSDKYAIVNNGDTVAYRHIGIPYGRSYLADGYGVRFRFFKEFLEISKNVFFSGEVPRKTTFEHQDTNLVVAKGDQKIPDPLFDDTSLLLEAR
ncbi:MAG: MBL fold metallo-hydrolase, partial [bacterium]|nr:MBL fold metallo-hydrolase [bacterium]